MSRRTIGLLFAGYAALVIAYAFGVPKCFQRVPPGAAAFGEMFGAFSAFFTGLAFLGIIYTIWLQRQELEQTKVALARTAAAQEKSERALSAQIRAAAISARLSAISLLIREEINHLKVYHERQLGPNHPESLTESQIDKYVGEFERKETAGEASPGEKCFLGNMRTLRDLKKDLRSLYNEIRELSV
jgi:hypothetical protein